ncbi:branched-chain amino acid ABC transporter permease [Bradyrhizobium sediminis]|uniref:Branched-chain amino acid ABC transporter permease n=1 Tax=Bradyrhizobium sediminis TaxID=2840469 RepID=A0A975P0Y2_9BRAD|nr:branched-chain amino acid ABC transporter permease [Bradyrhizobium sediminis]QWG24129.1 branched-chain amino acid ABC transporter permease [Bradyrhizobium sediminis]
MTTPDARKGRGPDNLVHLPSILIVAVTIAGSAGAAALANALWLKVLTSVAIYTLTAAGIALLYRRLGQVSLAHVALMGCGGWVALRLAHGTGLPFEFNLLAGGLFAAITSMLLAYPALRMRGLYLALVTLMAAGGFSVLISVIQFPNGGDGFTGFAVRSVSYMPRPWLAQSDQGYFVYCIGTTILGFGLIKWHEAGRPGRAWALIRRSEASAIAAGVNVTLYKIWGSALSGFVAGIAGGLLAGSLQLLDARSFPASESVLIFALTIVGGAWSWLGAVIAAILYRLAPALLNDWGVNGNAAFIIFGVALIHALITAPSGLAGQISSGVSALLSKRGSRP